MIPTTILIGLLGMTLCFVGTFLYNVVKEGAKRDSILERIEIFAQLFTILFIALVILTLWKLHQ